jgi:nicotinamidase-related amidase
MERLVPQSTVLFVVDVQERLAAAMPQDVLASLLRNVTILLETARLLGVRVLSSEQYPKGLGKTVPDVATRLAALGGAPVAKQTFDACGELSLARALASAAPRSVVLVGMETHVCVFQTARELVRRGHVTYVVADAVASRAEESRRVGLSLCERAGAIISTTEAVAFDLLERAGTDAFRAISKLIR